MAKATWKDTIIAESETYETVEGNIYFPPDSVKKEHLEDSNYHTTCPIKGKASYYNVVVNGEVNNDAAWYYPEPKPGYEHIKNYIAFWHGININK